MGCSSESVINTRNAFIFSIANSILSLWILLSSGLVMIHGSESSDHSNDTIAGGGHFLVEPNNTIVKTGETVTFVWIYEDTTSIIQEGRLTVETHGDDRILFRSNPITKESHPFGSVAYKKRVKISLAVPLEEHKVSVQVILSNVTTNDTGIYVFKILYLSGTPSTQSKVSLSLTERPHSVQINNTKPGNITRKVGELLYLKCEVFGTPTPTVTWFTKRNEKLAIGSGSAVLNITYINEQQAGVYTCKGENSEGEVQSSIFVAVHYLNVECSSALLYEDGKLFGRFTAVGNPDPVCTRRNSKGSIARIKCESNGLVEMTPSDVNVSLSARNSAELEKSCFIINVGQPSGTVLKSYSLALLTALQLIVSLL